MKQETATSLFILVTLLMGVTYCSLKEEPKSSQSAVSDLSDKTKQAYFIEEAKDAVVARLKDPESAKFRNVFYHYNKRMKHIVCGEFSAKNGYGGYNAYSGFISNSTPQLTIFASDMKSAKEFSKSWNEICIN